MPLPISCRIHPASNSLLDYWPWRQKKPPINLRYDCCFWWLNNQPYTLEYWAAWPWWYFVFKHCDTGQTYHVRVLRRDISAYDHWQLALLFEFWKE